MNYQVLDVKVKDTEEIGKLYTYFLDNSQEIDPNRVRPVIDLPGRRIWNGLRPRSRADCDEVLGAGYHAVILRYSVAPWQLITRPHFASLPGLLRVSAGACGRISH